MQSLSPLDIRPLTDDTFRPYGWLLGKGIPAFHHPDIDFWRQHLFNPGSGGETEILRVNYRNGQREVSSLEVHRLCEQAIIPLTGEIIQVVAISQKDGSPDMRSLSAFRVPVGEAICMQPGCWHTTRVDAHEVSCLMLTRSSTTIDLVAHLSGGSLLLESAIAAIDTKLLR